MCETGRQDGERLGQAEDKFARARDRDGHFPCAPQED